MTITYADPDISGADLHARPQFSEEATWETGLIQGTELTFDGTNLGTWKFELTDPGPHSVYEKVLSGTGFDKYQFRGTIDPSFRASVALTPSVLTLEPQGTFQNLTGYVGDVSAHSFSVFEADRVTPFSLTGKTLRMVFADDQGEHITQIESASLAVSGDDSNVLTWNWPAAVVDAQRKGRWSLRDVNAGNANLKSGEFRVLFAPPGVS